MRLTQAELKQFDAAGYLFFPNRFSSEEGALIKQAADEVYAIDRQEVCGRIPASHGRRSRRIPITNHSGGSEHIIA